MKNMTSGLLLAGALLLSGCAANPVDSAPVTAQASAREQASAGKPDDYTLTGSRLARRSNDRMVKSIGAQDARNAMESSPRPLRGE